MTDIVSGPSDREVRPGGPSAPTPSLVYGRPPLWWRSSTWVIFTLCIVVLVVTYFVVAASGFASATGGCGGG